MDASELSSNEVKQPSAVDEIGWMNAPTPTRSGASKQVRDLMKVSPTVLTAAEILDATPSKAVGDLRISYSTIRPTVPTDGPCVHNRENIGQVILSARGETSLRLYSANSTKPFATYEVHLGGGSTLPSLPPELPAPMKVLFQWDRPHPADTSGDVMVLVTDAVSTLRKLRGLLATDPTLKAQFIGRASVEGPMEYNYDLGRRRAEWVVQQLDLDPERIMNPPNFELGSECRQVRPGVVTCGSAEASVPLSAVDRHVAVTLFKPR